MPITRPRLWNLSKLLFAESTSGPGSGLQASECSEAAVGVICAVWAGDFRASQIKSGGGVVIITFKLTYKHTLSLKFLKVHLHIGTALYAKSRLLVGILVSGPNHQALNAFPHIGIVVAPLTMRVLCGCLLNPAFWGKVSTCYYLLIHLPPCGAW